MKPTNVVLTVDGMHCDGCAEKVRKAILAVPCVTGATVTFTTKQAVVEGDAPAKMVIAALAKAGYRAKTAP